jgi:hypothetical protein
MLRSRSEGDGLLGAIPNAWRRARVTRADLPAFPFESDAAVEVSSAMGEGAIRRAETPLRLVA